MNIDTQDLIDVKDRRLSTAMHESAVNAAIVVGLRKRRAEYRNDDMLFRWMICLSLSGCCAHQTLFESASVKAHEEQHCVDWGIPKERWVYLPFDAEVCKKACVDAIACAVTDFKTCSIYADR